MFKKFFHIVVSMALVFSTTASIWEHLLSDVDDPIELSSESESESEKDEKENKKESEEGDDSFAIEAYNFTADLFSGFQKIGSCSFAPLSGDSEKLYILFQRLKLDC